MGVTLRDRLDQLWGWAKAGRVVGREGEPYYLMDVENVDRFTDDVLRIIAEEQGHPGVP
jgi:hypothetical protein